MRDVVTNEARCIHRTRLTRDGHKVSPPFMLGPAKNTAIKLDADSLVTTGLTVAEGLEIALSARAMGFRPAWALGSAGGIGTFPVLAGVERLNLSGEHDERATNEKEVMNFAERWRRAGRETHVFWSDVGNDLNDEWQARNAIDKESWLSAVEELWPGAAPFPEDEPQFREQLRERRAQNAYRSFDYA